MTCGFSGSRLELRVSGFFAIIACALLSSCAPPEPIEIAHAWSPPTPPGATAAAVYLEINAREDDVLLAAATPVAQRAEMHTTIIVDDMMQMRPLASLRIPAGETVRFEPRGHHFMLTDLRTSQVAGASFPLTLRFERAGEILCQVSVRTAGEH